MARKVGQGAWLSSVCFLFLPALLCFRKTGWREVLGLLPREFFQNVIMVAKTGQLGQCANANLNLCMELIKQNCEGCGCTDNFNYDYCVCVK